MALSSELVSEFVKITKDDTKVPTETTVYGTIVYDGKTYVKLDGSDLLTPVSTTTDVKDGERVTVMIKDHTATVTGNISSPAARTDAVKDSVGQELTDDDIQASNAHIESLLAVLADISYLNVDELNAVIADIEKLRADFAAIDYIDANTAKILNAEIENLSVKFGNFTDIKTEDLEALNAEITNLKGYTADFTYISAERFEAARANIKHLTANSATIDFANVTEAAFVKIFSESGMIRDFTMGNGTITGELIGVTIRGDLIKANTLVADMLVVRGTDGEYYKLSTDFSAMEGVEPVEEDAIHGSTIVARSVTAEKMSVTELAAFEATIGGFSIIGADEETKTVGAIYSGAKADIAASTPGIYLGQDGQMSLGDAYNYIRFHKAFDSEGKEVLDDDGNPVYKLEISADSIVFGATSKSSMSDIEALTNYVKIVNQVDPETGDVSPSLELSEGESGIKQVITNESTRIMDGANVITEMNANGVESENVTVRTELRQGQWAWVQHGRGNLGLRWKG